MIGRLTLMSCTTMGLVLALPHPVWAHVGLGHSNGLGAGFLHPLVGLDHLLAMLAVGFWSAQLGGRALWLVPLSFVAVMSGGFLLGMSEWPLPLVEQGILASVVVLGLLIAGAWQLPAGVSCAIVALFALCHGHAHGTEMPMDTSGLAYAAGFVTATAVLHLSGLGLGRLVQGPLGVTAQRLAGAAIVLAGLYLTIS
jgi:urease accessory protein